ncbi:hypothetical protein HFP15_07845 [Amycolatopsis sp. K13G38]|uniref:Uncharacterized protein n=1 Tax=Amycolatopsis acididurans TaxID=2724524 RepID=A0ABX1J3B7_9PSEU|nr:hypothetical protein [Amycolatopsis acididurans]NKQ52792.1 hypothetical protein [Amycolatopsis acididurans]
MTNIVSLRDEPFGLEAYLARRHAEFAGGPTMAEILDDLDRHRDGSRLTTGLIVASVRAGRDGTGDD